MTSLPLQNKRPLSTIPQFVTDATISTAGMNKGWSMAQSLATLRPWIT